jgi:MSHA pilin protein MshC
VLVSVNIEGEHSEGDMVLHPSSSGTRRAAPAAHDPQEKFCPGFTLIELILVVILLGILVASAAPKFLDTTRFSLEGAGAMIVADIRHTQELAMSSHLATSVSFVLGSTSYTVAWQAAPVKLPSRVSITSANITFTFNPLGEPTAGGGGLVIIGAGGNTKTITVENYTGKATVS